MFAPVGSVPALVIVMFGASAVLVVIAATKANRNAESTAGGTSIFLWSTLIYAGAVAAVFVLWLMEQG